MFDVIPNGPHKPFKVRAARTLSMVHPDWQELRQRMPFTWRDDKGAVWEITPHKTVEGGRIVHVRTSHGRPGRHLGSLYILPTND